MACFKRIILYKTWPKIKLLLQKIAKSLGAGGFAPRPPMPIGGWGLSPHIKSTALPLRFLAVNLARSLY